MLLSLNNFVGFQQTAPMYPKSGLQILKIEILLSLKFSPNMCPKCPLNFVLTAHFVAFARAKIYITENQSHFPLTHFYTQKAPKIPKIKFAMIFQCYFVDGLK